MVKRELGTEFRNTGRKRDVLPDLLKGFGIILVVLGHCIQASYGEGDTFFEDKLYQLIYSFHMPLFMVVSGYYAWNSIHRAVIPQERWKMIKKKCVYLITPNVAWKLIEYLYLFATGAYVYSGRGVLVKEVIIGILTNFWFLWAVFYSFLLVCLMHYKFHDSIWMYVLVFIAMFFTPDGLGLMACKYVLPYYLIGFYVNKHKNFLLAKTAVLGDERRRKGAAFFVSGILFFVLMSFFNVDSFVYLTGYKLIGKDYWVQLRIDVYRFLVGLCGIVFLSLFWSILLNLCGQWKIGMRLLAYLGTKGMGIYIVAGIPMRYLVFQLAEDGKPCYGVNLAQTVFILFWSVIIVEVLSRIKGVQMLVGQ